MMSLQAMPAALKDIMSKVVKSVNAEIKKNTATTRLFPTGIEDKSSQYCEILDELVSWYMNIRQHGMIN